MKWEWRMSVVWRWMSREREAQHVQLLQLLNENMIDWHNERVPGSEQVRRADSDERGGRG